MILQFRETVLEELDNFKRNDTKTLKLEFTRIVDKLSAEHTLQDWIPLGKIKTVF